MRRLVDWLDHNVAAEVTGGTPAVTRFVEGLDGLEAAIDRGCAGRREWPQRVVAGLGAALSYAAENPRAARVLAIESAEPGSADRHRHREMVERLAERLGSGAPRRPLASSERALVASVLGVIAERVRVGREKDLPAVAPELACLLLMPYLGFEGARRQSAR